LSGVVRIEGARSTAIVAHALGTDTAGLKLPVRELMGSGRLRTEGQKRGTKYFAGGGKRRKAKAAKKARKAGRRKVARKARRKATKKGRRKLSPEQRAALVERLAKARAARKAG